MRPVAASILLLLLSGGITVAQADPPTPAQILSRPTPQNPCMGQYEKFCSAVPSGAGRKLMCMMSHLSQLAPLCRTRTQAVYNLEYEQAVKMHMTVPQFMAWGQGMPYKVKRPSSAPAPAPAPAANNSPQPNQSSAKQN